MNWSKPDFWDFSPFCNGALVPKGSFEERRVALNLRTQVAWICSFVSMANVFCSIPWAPCSDSSLLLLLHTLCHEAARKTSC